MAKLQLDTRWRLNDLPTVLLENKYLRAIILPTVGARIYQLIYKPHDRNLIWNHPRIQPAAVPFGARYEDVWCGGWDELFPNNPPTMINGELYPDHGEIWATQWDYTTRTTSAEIAADFYCHTRISDVHVRKVIALRADEPSMRVSYSLENRSMVALPMMWILHVALAVSAHHRIAFPPMRVRLEPASRGTISGADLEFDWPFAETPDGTIDLREIPPASEGRFRFFYGTQLGAGWCGLTDTRSNLACGLSFDRKVFPSCWLFGSFGGWRNLNVAVLEPSTAYPFNIEEALKNGTCPLLAPAQIMSTSVIFSVAENVKLMSSINPDGLIQ